MLESSPGAGVVRTRPCSTLLAFSRVATAASVPTFVIPAIRSSRLWRSTRRHSGPIWSRWTTTDRSTSVCVRRVRDLCRDRRPQIWHGHDYKTNVLGALLRRRSDVRLVTTAHGWVVAKLEDAALLRARSLELARLRGGLLRFGRSEEGLPRLRRGSRALSAAAERDRHRGVSAPPIDRRGQGGSWLSRRENAAPGDRPSRFGEGLRPPDRCRRAAACASRWTSSSGSPGGDPRRTALRHRAERLAPGRIQFLGYRRDVPDLLESADMFVLSSLREGLPNVVLEAMALEVPVVCTAVAGVPALVEHQRTGWLVAPGSAGALAAGIRALAEAPGLGAALALEGRRRIERSHGFAARMNRVMETYDRLLDSPLGAAGGRLVDGG